MVHWGHDTQVFVEKRRGDIEMGGISGCTFTPHSVNLSFRYLPEAYHRKTSKERKAFHAFPCISKMLARPLCRKLSGIFVV